MERKERIWLGVLIVVFLVALRLGITAEFTTATPEHTSFDCTFKGHAALVL